mmetsp:Transcript_50782/g.146509  ORF Transcript_50782/g.146509 Transcript_50782/m.146509 type:complete len:313 (+) Transcript_50782:1255-2193(+)
MATCRSGATRTPSSRASKVAWVLSSMVFVSSQSPTASSTPHTYSACMACKNSRAMAGGNGHRSCASGPPSLRLAGGLWPLAVVFSAAGATPSCCNMERRAALTEDFNDCPDAVGLAMTELGAAKLGQGEAEGADCGLDGKAALLSEPIDGQAPAELPSSPGRDLRPPEEGQESFAPDGVRCTWWCCSRCGEEIVGPPPAGEPPPLASQPPAVGLTGSQGNHCVGTGRRPLGGTRPPSVPPCAGEDGGEAAPHGAPAPGSPAAVAAGDEPQAGEGLAAASAEPQDGVPGAPLHGGEAALPWAAPHGDAAPSTS